MRQKVPVRPTPPLCVCVCVCEGECVCVWGGGSEAYFSKNKTRTCVHARKKHPSSHLDHTTYTKSVLRDVDDITFC